MSRGHLACHSRFGSVSAGLLAGVILAGPAWAQAPEPASMSPSALPGWASEAPGKAWDALSASCAAWAGMPPDRSLLTPAPPRPEGDSPVEPSLIAGAATPLAWRRLCEAAAALAREHPVPEAPRRGNSPAAVAQREAVAAATLARDAAFRDLLEERTVAVPLGTGLLTGYFEPILRGSRTADLRHRTPLLGRPGAAAAPDEAPATATPAPRPVLTNWAGVPRPNWPDPSSRPRAGGTAGAAHEPPTRGARAAVVADPVAKPETEETPQAEPPDASAEPGATGLASGHGLPPPGPGGRLPSLPSRAAIEAGALAGRGLELVYVDSAVDAFFLHIQGSGRVLLADGKMLRLGYAAQNGHPYVPIGRILIARGAIPRERMTMQAIRSWLAEAPPNEAMALMGENPSYVFFRVLEGLLPDEGPPGSLGVPLIPGRSLAVDRAHVPMGAPVFVEGRDPITGAVFQRLMMAQDTGGAIRGRARGDLFFGWGDAAGDAAGRTRDEARFWVLVPREPPIETAAAP